MKYLVFGTAGPGFASEDEALELLEFTVLPSFEMLMAWEKEKKIVAGGLPVGERAFSMIMEAPNHEELDDWLRSLPIWGLVEWEVTPLQPFAARAAREKKEIKELKKALNLD
ncbi:MAG: muconolactone Delta-isomerase family protein [Deltaproteobacteria bacterium]|nr:muconolactone Delta-isomerase family protein [Deltaproteobacteria bacterium]